MPWHESHIFQFQIISKLIKLNKQMLSSKNISVSIINLPFITVRGSFILSWLFYSKFEPFLMIEKFVKTLTKTLS